MHDEDYEESNWVTYLDESGKSRSDLSKEALQRELNYCRHVQSWNQGTRTGWVDELQDLADAIDNDAHPRRIGALLRTAERKAIDLAIEVVEEDYGDHIFYEAAVNAGIWNHLPNSDDHYNTLLDLSEGEQVDMILASGETLECKPKHGDYIEINPEASFVSVYVRNISNGFVTIKRDLLTGVITDSCTGRIIERES